MPRVQKLWVESLERRALLAGDLMSSLSATTAADTDIGLDQAAIQADAAAGGALNTGLLGASADANAGVDATLTLGLGGAVDDVLNLGTSPLDSLQNILGRTVSSAESTVGNVLGNTGDTAEHVVNHVTDTVDDLVDDVDGTVDDVTDDVSNVVGDITANMPLNDLLDDLGSALHVDDLAGSLGLANLSDALPVNQVHGINGLINSEGRNLNGFLHSLPNKLHHVTSDVVGAVGSTGLVDNVFTAIGQTRHGLLH